MVLMNQRICKGKVGEAVTIDIVVKEFFAAVEVSISVVVVNHRSYTIKTVSVHMELIEPILDIAEQEVSHLALAIVKNHRVPIGVITLISGKSIAVICAINSV